MTYPIHADARKSPYDIHAQLVYCDPPTNRRHDEMVHDDDMPEDLYAQFAIDWLHDVVPKVANPGRLVLCCNTKKRYLYEKYIRETFGLEFEQELILHYVYGHYGRHRFYHAHDNILVYRRGFPEFNWLAVAITSERQKVNDPRADPRGKVPGSVWTMPRNSQYNIDRNRFMDTPYRSTHPLPFCERLVLAYTKTHDMVYDPFSGFGTMAVACKNLHRRYCGHDICEQYVKESIDRVNNRDWARYLMTLPKKVREKVQ